MGQQKLATHFFIDMLQKAATVADRVENGANVLKVIAASEAFRKYNWIRNAPVLNAAGDFRGTVLSARWRSVFHFSSDLRDFAGNIAVLAGFATNLAHSSSRIEAIWRSNDPMDLKAARISTQVSSAAIRTLGGFIPDGAHLLSMSLQGYCRMADLATAGTWTAPRQCLTGLQSGEVWVRTTFDKVTDGDYIYLQINTHILPR